MKRTLPLLPVLMVLVLWCLPVAYPDGRIDSDDLLNVAENWQRTGGGPGDFTGDGVVDQADLLYIIQCWKQATSPTSTPTFTFTPTGTGTDISTFTPTITATWTGTSTRTSTPTITLTSTPTPTATPEEIIIDIPGLPEDATPLILVRIPAGEFLMGRYPGEQDSQDYEDPQHYVDIGYDFYIGKYEITKAQWEAIMGTTPWSGKNYILDHPDSPAVYVSWNDIRNAAGSTG
ncbi:SUMF1/EgtB/PvdO family nonheme iron enzyme [bacterium]|nr:SUMF1/EgtB/PvdO family nonheme iron enzyme [bacterium]